MRFNLISKYIFKKRTFSLVFRDVETKMRDFISFSHKLFDFVSPNEGMSIFANHFTCSIVFL